MKTTILVQWERVLAERVTLPQKNRWTRRAIAQFLGINRITVKNYAEVIAPVIRDYRQLIPKESGRFRTGYALDQYQFWVICKIAAFMQLLRIDLNGSTYTKDAAQIIAKHQKYLSYEVFVYDTNMHSDSAA